jgi:tetratricopeptide (TPR) repeat protein
MYNVLLSLGVGALVFAVSTLVLPAVAGILPAVLAAGAAFLLLSRRTALQMEAELRPLMGLIQARKIDEAAALLRKVKDTHGRWQPFVAGQIDAQLGMIAYAQQKFEEARPLLEAGRWRNWQATACLAAIHHRLGDKAQAFKLFDEAILLAPKEPMAYVVPAVLRHRDDEREAGLQTLGRGLAQLPGQEVLEELQGRLANKQSVEISRLPELWFQFYPEDMGKVLQMQRRPGMGAPAVQPGPPQNRKARRSR